MTSLCRRLAWQWVGVVFAGVLVALSLGCASGEPAVRTVMVRAVELRFEPATVTVRRDEVVRLVLRNDGILPHDLKIEELPAVVQRPDGTWVYGEVHVRAESRQQAAVVFSASTPGV